MIEIVNWKDLHILWILMVFYIPELYIYIYIYIYIYLISNWNSYFLLF